MKRIGICTLCEASNMGTLLQAFAMQEILKKMGYEPEFLRFEHCIIDEEDRCTLEFIEMRKHLNLSNHYYNPNEDKYDAIIVGSDEIWNVLNFGFTHIDEFIGYNLNAPKIIAYAPGANQTNGDTFIKYYKGKRDLSHFTSLSGRDTNAIDIIKKVANLDAPLLLDPTLLMDSYDPYIEKCNEKNYILVYGWFFKDEDKQAIKEFAKSKNLKLISVGFKLKWCDEFIGSDIFRFLSYMKDATYVVTSETFHGNVFSAYYNKQFVATTHGRAKSRELLERLGLGERDCYSPEEIKEKLNKSIDYRNVNKWLEMERNKAIDYLKNSIEG